MPLGDPRRAPTPFLFLIWNVFPLGFWALHEALVAILKAYVHAGAAWGEDRRFRFQPGSHTERQDSYQPLRRLIYDHLALNRLIGPA